MPFMPFGGACSMHLGVYNQCSLPQVPALAHTNRLMALQYSKWKKDNHLASSKTNFFSNDLFLLISGLCLSHSYQRCNRLIVAADSDYYSVVGVSEIRSAYWKLARQYHQDINRALGRRGVKLETLAKNDQFVCPTGKRKSNSWVCFAGGPRPRKPRVWKSRIRRGTVSKAAKLVDCVKALSNIKEEVYGALDSFIAWEIEFPLITVKKALKTLRAEKEWKRIIQIIKWMLSKGQGKTMGNYFLLLHALAEEERIEEAEELWMQIFTKNLEHVPRLFFTRIIAMYDKNNMSGKLLEVFADMEELGVKPDYSTVMIIAKTFKNLGMLDKYDKVLKKYPQPDQEYRYYKGKRVKVQMQKTHDSGSPTTPDKDEDANEDEDEGESTIDPFFATEGTRRQNETSQPLQERWIMLE